MRILISPDKFKNSLTAYEVCDAIERGIKKVKPKAEVIKLPLADGGEGTLDILEQQLGAIRVEKEVSNPLFKPVNAYYLLKEEKAYIEMAKASGLPLLSAVEKSATKTSTYGTGELILDAIDRGANDVYVMIGGSATNDGGCGMAEALGAKFYSKSGTELSAIRGGDLSKVHSIDLSLLERFSEVKFTVLSDVQNPLTGKNGASHVFGAQKGATQADIEFLDDGLKNLAKILDNGNEDKSGAGSAGGLGYGLMSFLNAELKSGIGQVFEFLEYDRKLLNVDLIITGEGKLDGQTLGGKVIYGVANKAKENKIPIGIICGIAEEIDRVKANLDIQMIYQVFEKAKGFRDSMQHASIYVEELAKELIQSLNK